MCPSVCNICSWFNTADDPVCVMCGSSSSWANKCQVIKNYNAASFQKKARGTQVALYLFLQSEIL